MALLELRRVVKWFDAEGTRVDVLHGVDLLVGQGGYVAIVGPSGSGKSTLLNIIALLDSPSQGAYAIDGDDVAGLPETARARVRSTNFGFVFQAFHLMPHRSAIDNVEVGLVYRGVRRGERRERAQRALESVGLAHRAELAARKLSGGEKQRVALARAIVARPRILVADEPTGNLDSVNSEAVVDLLADLHGTGTAIVLVTHDPAVASSADRVLGFSDGTFAAGVSATDDSACGQLVAPAEPIIGKPSVMRLRDVIGEAWRVLTARAGRAFGLIAAVAVSVALVVTTLGLSLTASSQVSSTFDVLRNREVSVQVPIGSADPVGTSIPLDVDRHLDAVSGVQAAGSVVQYNPLEAAVPHQPAVAQCSALGMSTGAFRAVGAVITWAAGHAHRLGQHEVLVGSLLAKSLQLGPLDLDPVVDIGGSAYGVAGVVTRSTQLPQLVADLTVNWRDADELGSVVSANVYLLTASGAAPQVARQAPIAINPVTASQMQVTSPPDPDTLRGAIQSDIRSALLALTITALLAALIGVANAMLMSVLERVGELGLRRAIGARRIHVVAQTATEGMLAGVAGGAVGLVAGMFTIMAVTLAHHWQPVFELWLIPLAVVSGAVVGTAGGLPASWRAGRIEPADALRR